MPQMTAVQSMLSLKSVEQMQYESMAMAASWRAQSHAMLIVTCGLSVAAP